MPDCCLKLDINNNILYQCEIGCANTINPAGLSSRHPHFSVNALLICIVVYVEIKKTYECTNERAKTKRGTKNG